MKTASTILFILSVAATGSNGANAAMTCEDEVLSSSDVETDVHVPDGSVCTIDGITVTGEIKVGNGARLKMIGAQVHNFIECGNCAMVDIKGCPAIGGVDIKSKKGEADGEGRGLFIKDGWIEAAVLVDGAENFPIILENTCGTEKGVFDVLISKVKGDYLKFVARDGSCGSDKACHVGDFFVGETDFAETLISGTESCQINLRSSTTIEKNKGPISLENIVIDGDMAVIGNDKVGAVAVKNLGATKFDDNGSLEIDCENIQEESLEVTRTQGDVRISKCDFSGSLTCEANGNVILDDVSCGTAECCTATM